MSKVEELLKAYKFDYLEEEGCFFKKMYESSFQDENGLPCSSSMLGLYSKKENSKSYFHILTHDELWYYQGGDPIALHLIYPDGTYECHMLGKDEYQVLIKAGVHQAADTMGTYSLFGCNVVPGFTMDCFKMSDKEELLKLCPSQKEMIEQFTK